MHYPFMIILIISSIILYIIFTINHKISKYIVCLISILSIIIILYYYHHLITLSIFKYPHHNIYFYYLNSIIYLIIVTIEYFKQNKKTLLNIIFCLNFILLSYSLFITHYLGNNTLIVIGNIYPMIVLGNYIYFFFYIYLIKCHFDNKQNNMI